MTAHRAAFSVAPAAVLVSLLVGCNAGTIEMSPREQTAADSGPGADAGVPEDGGPTVRARTVFDEQVWPILDTDCTSCHAADRTGPAFLAADPTPYEELFEWPSLIALDDPPSSRLLTKGEHAGPAFTDAQETTVREWIAMEADERRSGGGDGGTPEPDTFETDPVAIEDGLNEVDLEPAGAPGASITFIASTVDDVGIYLSELRLVAGARGARVKNPTLVFWEGGEPEPDRADRFSGIDVSVAPYTSQQIGSGSASLVDFPDGGRLSFVFDSASTLEAADGGVPTSDGGMPMGDGGTGTGSGCSAVGAFTDNAQPQFGSLCVTCHGGSDATATSAVDMTSMGDLSAEGQQAACNEILARANLDDPASSIFFLKPDPASDLTHPFKFRSSTQLDAFRDAVLAWLTME